MEHIDLKVIHTDKSYIGKKVTVCGWVRTSRDSKNVAFVELNDGSQLEHVQVVFEKSLFADATLAPMLALGAALQVTGTVEKGMKDESVEIRAQSASLLGGCDTTYPLQKSGTPWSFCAPYRTCACAPTRLTQCSACVANCRTPYTSFSTTRAIIMCTRP